MAVRFHPLPPEVFPDEARPSIVRLNAELRDLFALEGTMRNPLTVQRSDSTVVRKSTDQVHITRITPEVISVVSGITFGVGLPNLTFGTANTAGTTSTAVSVDSALAIFDGTAPADVATSSAVGTAAFAARRDHAHDVSNIVLNDLATATADYSMGGFGFTNVDDVRSVAGVQLELVAEDSGHALTEAFRINWDLNDDVATTEKVLSVGYTDAADVYQEMLDVEHHSSAVGTLLRILPGAGTRGMLGFGNAGSFPKAGLLFIDSQIRLRVNNFNAMAVQHDGNSPGVAQWICQNDVKEFRFNFDNSASADANTTDAALWRFRSNLAITRGTFFQIDNASTDIFLVDYLGKVTTFGGRVVDTTRITGNTTLDATHHNVFADTDGGAFTVTLPAGVAGTTYRIINSGSSANNLTITPDGAELLLGVNSNFTLLDGDVLVIVYEATEGWW